MNIMQFKKTFALVQLLGGIAAASTGDFTNAPLEINGAIVSDFQAYRVDSAAGAENIPEEKMGSNSYFSVTARKSGFALGLRLEAYAPVLQGFDARYEGIGLAHRYLEYSNDFLNATVGNFYEQFGNGLVLRTYHDWNLGYDNAFDGIRLSVNALKGIRLKGVFARQRLYFETGEGIVRGLDGELFINDLLTTMKPAIGIGGSFVSKYQKANHPTLNLPANVACWALRGTFTLEGISWLAEYARKINDPSAANGMLYQEGNVLYTVLSYSRPGAGITLSAKRVDNMDFRSDRGATANDLIINYIPDLSVLQTHSLSAMYPYASQPLGEASLQGDGFFTIPGKTFLGGRKGMGVRVNFTQVNDIGRTPHANVLIGYEPSKLWSDTLFYRNINAEVDRWFGKKVKGLFIYNYVQRNDALLNLSDYHRMIYAHVAVADVKVKLNSKNSLRVDVEHLYTRQDNGNWLSGALEWQTRRFSLFVSDDYNLGNDDAQKRLHYYSVGGTVTRKTSQLALSYGRRRAGIICTGGVCRAVPTMNGLAATLSTSF